MLLKKTIPVLALFFIITGTTCTQKHNSRTSSEKPNVIFFVLDDLNDWINPLGYKQVKTPNLDRLAEAGVTFKNAHAPASYCAPSRTAIFTGLQSTTTGCYRDEVYHYDYPDLVPLQMAFKQGGYNAYGAGKLFHHRAGFVDLRGWDEFFARSQEIKDMGYEMGSRGSDYLTPDPVPYSSYYTKTDKELTGGSFMEWGPIADSLEEKVTATIRTNWVCDILKQTHEKPFFIALGLYHPHFPNYAPQKYFDLYDLDKIQVPELKADDLDDLPPVMRKRMTNRSKIQKTLEEVGAVKEAVRAYLAAVSYADAMLGRILDTLEKSEYKDNTVLIMWSDQGYHHGEKGNWGKHTLWKETSHVPLIFAGADLPKNKTVGTTVGLIDLYPTLIELCDLPKQHKMDGVSLVSSIKEPSSAKDRDLFVPYHERGSYAVINSNWRYIYYKEGTEELYNLKEDPNEWYNLAGKDENQHVIQELQKAAPAEFSPDATPKKNLRLIIEGDTFHWESKVGGTPVGLKKKN